MKTLLIHPNDGTDIRTSKTCRSLSRLGFEMHFVGWDRRPAVEKEIGCGRARLHILRYATKYGRNSWVGYLLYSIYVLFNLLRIRPDTVVCVNEEPALIVLPFRKILYRRLVCELYDGIVERCGEKRSRISSLIIWYGNFIRRAADKIIVTDERRLELLGPHCAKAVVIGNFPEDPGDTVTALFPTGKTKIYVYGSLSLSRGLQEILAAAERVDDVEIISAGWLYDRFATETLIKHPKVTYVGIVSGIEALRLAARCDAVFSYYAPTNKNNIYASPNKIYDALSVGRPIIINSETVVSRWVVENRYGWSCRYDDLAALSQILQMIRGARPGLADFTARARKDFKNLYRWEKIETLLASAYADNDHAQLARQFDARPADAGIDLGSRSNTSAYRICTNCVMDTSDAMISFDKHGVCDHCRRYDAEILPNWHTDERGWSTLQKSIGKIRKNGAGKDFDCIIGVSGGIDSSYLTYIAKEKLGLRPLVFHVDAGWNSQVAVNNIEKLVEKLHLDLYTEVIDWEEMRDLQLAFFKSGVPHIDLPQDHAFFATMYNFAEKYRVKYILTGSNISTECVRNPKEWIYYGTDTIHIRDIHAKYGQRPLVHFPLSNIFRHKIFLRYFKGIEVVTPLNYIPYKKESAMQFLADNYGWQKYPQKHYESRFTKFYEGYWLPKKFGYDTRRVHYSSLILTGQMTREDALEKLARPSFDAATIAQDFEYVATKLGISVTQLQGYLDAPNKTVRDYRSQENIFQVGAKIMKVLGLEKRKKKR